VVQVSVEKQFRLLIGKDAAVGRAGGCKRRHHPGITVHPAKLAEVLGAQAFGDQTLSVEGFYRLHVFDGSE
jgi:hypothetical protein